jgi:hypothetical protein
MYIFASIMSLMRRLLTIVHLCCLLHATVPFCVIEESSLITDFSAVLILTVQSAWLYSTVFPAAAGISDLDADLPGETCEPSIPL